MAAPTALTTIQAGDNDSPSTVMSNMNIMWNILNGEVDLGNFRSSPTEAQRVTEVKLNLRTKCFLNIITNGDMEAWDAGASTYPAGWAAESSPAAVARDTAEQGHGAYCVKITTTDADDGMKQTLTNLKASTIYRLSCRAKVTSGDTANLITTGATTNVDEETTSTSWTNLTALFTTDGSGTDVVVKVTGSGGAGDVVWFDEVVCTEGTAQVGYQPPGHALNMVYCNADSDAVDVTHYGADTIIVADTGSGNVTIGGLAGGVDGQRVYIVKINTSNTLTIEHNEGTGTQKIYTPGEDDLSLTGYGGVTLLHIAGVWYQVAE